MSLPVVLAGIAGLCVGSFLNVCIHRLPLRTSVIFPPSRCPACGTVLRAIDLVPLLSYLRLRGQCRSCGKGIALRYPMVELATAAGFVAVVARWGPGLAAFQAAVFLSLLIVACFTDLETGIIPNRVTIPGTIVGLALMAFGPAGPVPAVLGMVAGGGALLLLALVSGGGMGGGDVKLGALMGAFLGWPDIGAALAVAFLAGGVAGIVLLAARRKRRRDPIPFGPFLVAGAVAALFWSASILGWYGRFLRPS
ncbi:MAG TPA: prepilin peptidase [Clostridiales bacterium]|nr:prepilin peptidase [Clostridiales bacterium]